MLDRYTPSPLMAENISKISLGGDMGTSMFGGSPKQIYVFFLLSLCKNYFECAINGTSDDSLERATGALIAFCPDKDERQRLWDYYLDKKVELKSPYSASVMAIGELVSYLSAVLEFTEQSTGGLM